MVKPRKEAQLSRTHAPAGPVPIDWQRALRRQRGREQAFSLDNAGAKLFFPEFRVSNPQTKNVYRGAIRGTQPGDSFCACLDFTSNELGTCKHIACVPAVLKKLNCCLLGCEFRWRKLSHLAKQYFN